MSVLATIWQSGRPAYNSALRPALIVSLIRRVQHLAEQGPTLISAKARDQLKGDYCAAQKRAKAALR